jgi:hypothetical protein
MRGKVWDRNNERYEAPSAVHPFMVDAVFAKLKANPGVMKVP